VEPERIEIVRDQGGAAFVERAHVRVPCGHRLGLVEPGSGGNLVPEPLDVGLTEDRLRPAGRRARDHAPGTRLSRNLIVHDLAGAARLRLGGPALVDVVEEVRIGVAEGDNERSTLHLQERGLDPPWRPVELVLGRVERVETARVLVTVDRLDVARSGRPARRGDRPHQRCMLGLAEHEQGLAGLDVRSDPDGELRVAAPQLVDHAARLAEKLSCVNPLSRR
jgi:hypothetical protein